jgi:hypothetical protein
MERVPRVCNGDLTQLEGEVGGVLEIEVNLECD